MTQLQPGTVVDTVASVFTNFKDTMDLHLVDAAAESGWLTVHFAGQNGDDDGPYCARIQLPGSVGDEIWSAYTETDSLQEWCTYGVFIRILEEYETGRNQGRWNHSDGIFWLRLDERE